MANASTEVAAHGWHIFRTVPDPSLDAVNAGLQDQGLEPVSRRMFRHYRRLDANGFTEYLPINELDMRLKHRNN